MRVEPLLCAPAVSVFSVAHDDVVPLVEEEVAQHFSIAFVERGSFSVGIENRRWTLTAGDVLVSRPDAMHVYTHCDEQPDDTCISVRFRNPIAISAEVLRRSRRLAFLRTQLGRIVDAGDRMALEEWAGSLVAGITTAPAARERIERARRMIDSQFSDELTLDALAREAGMSSFHFARLFRDLVGTPPHRYLRNVRLERAHSMLRDGASVTSTCYDVGFSNLSHFIRSFRRRFGCVPSQERKKVQAKRA